MIQDMKRQIQKFIDLGLTEREAKVYIKLLTRKGFTTLELQDSVDIPRTKMYEVLQKMVARGIINQWGTGREKRYGAVEPRIAFNRVLNEYKDEYQTEIEKKGGAVESLLNTFTSIYEKNKDFASPLDFVEVFRDKSQIQKMYVKAIKETKYDFLTFNKGPYVCDNSKRLTEQKSEEAKLIKRGVVCRNIYEKKELSGITWLKKYVRHQVKLGQQARYIESLPIKMVVCDERTVIFPLLQSFGDTNSITMVFIEHHELAKTCKMLFNWMWEKSIPFK
jgi:HTH-type transcriptional regulator, sugar sensing transcriptional regulator